MRVGAGVVLFLLAVTCIASQVTLADLGVTTFTPGEEISSPDQTAEMNSSDLHEPLSVSSTGVDEAIVNYEPAKENQNETLLPPMNLVNGGLYNSTTVSSKESSNYDLSIETTNDTVQWDESQENVLQVENQGIPSTESNITVATWGTDQDNAAVWEDRIVWADRRGYVDEYGYYQSDIYLYNLTTGEETRLTSTPYDELMPDIWGDSVVWQVQGWEDNSSEIHLLNLSTGIDLPITNDFVNQVNPRIWGEWIVWQDGSEWDSEWGVSLYNCANGTPLKIGTLFARVPSIWEDQVVWVDSETGVDYDIYLYNITAGQQIQIPSDPSFLYPPSIWGERIVWEDYREVTPRIYLYNTSTGNTVAVTGDDSGREHPAISGDFLVYAMKTGMGDIGLTDLKTLQEGALSKDITGSDEFNPDIWNNRIVWTNKQNGTTDIYLSTLNISLPPLHAGFSENISQGKPPLTVAFTDITSGKASGWQWDFGDGNSSKEQNPVHQYLTSGSYSVTLTVYNAYQRDAIRKMNLVSVGSIPIPQFQAEPLSGPVPLEVQFHDASAGIPVQWQWDFGDGTGSEEQNPLHIFSVPGVYTVNLTVTNIFGTGSIGKKDLINVVNATHTSLSFPSEGITATTSGNTTWVVFNVTSPENWTFVPGADRSMVSYTPPEESGIAELKFMSSDESGFSYQGSDQVSGNLTGTLMRSSDLYSKIFSAEIGNSSWFNFTTAYDGYPADGHILVAAWEGSTHEDYLKFDKIASEAHYNKILGMACTVRLQESNATTPGSSSFTFAVSSDWVQEYGWSDDRDLEIATNVSGAMIFIDGTYMGVSPIVITNLTPGEHQLRTSKDGYRDNLSTLIIGSDKRDSIHVIRIGDNGSGEVLNTTFIGHDDEQNLDFFMAESPNGLSTFGLASLSRSGNLFRLFTIAVTQYVQGSGGGGGAGGGGGNIGGLATTPTTIPTPTPVPTLTLRPPAPTESQGSGSEVAGTTVSTTPPPSEPTQTSTSTQEDGEGWEWPPYLVILRNLSVVFAVIFVAVVFYLRWNKREA